MQIEIDEEGKAAFPVRRVLLSHVFWFVILYHFVMCHVMVAQHRGEAVRLSITTVAFSGQNPRSWLQP